MLKLIQWLLLLVIAILTIIKHKNSLRCLKELFFSTQNFIALCVEDVIKINCDKDTALKEKYEKDEKYRNEQKERFNTQFSISTQRLKDSIREGFWTVGKTLGFAWLIVCVVTNSIFFPVNLLFFLQIASAFFILWAIVGKTGYPIQTVCGETLPEKMDDFWFLFLNVFGILCVFLAQFYNFLK